jgi:hypothetical protein
LFEARIEAGCVILPTNPWVDMKEVQDTIRVGHEHRSMVSLRRRRITAYSIMAALLP